MNLLSDVIFEKSAAVIAAENRGELVLGRKIALFLALPAAIFVFTLLIAGKYGIILVLGVTAVGVLLWAARMVYRDALWLIFWLVLEETLPYLSLLPFDPNSRWWIRYPILLALCVPPILAGWRSNFFRRGFILGYFAYFGWGIISVTYSKDPGLCAGRLLPDIVLFCALCLIAERIQSTEDIHKVLDRYLMACSVLVLLNLVAWCLPPNVFIEGDSSPTGVYTWVGEPGGFVRFCGFLGQPNAIGALMLSTVCAGLVNWNSTARRNRLFLSIVMACSVFLALRADSRSSFIALATGIAAFTIWKYRFRGLVSCLGVLVLLVGIYSGMGRHERLYFNRELDTFTGRTTLWQFELTKLAENPLVGYGYDLEGSLFDDPHFPDWSATYAEMHDSYLSIAVDLGIPALVFWLFVWLSPWASLFRGQADDWHLKPVFFLVALPALVIATVESGLTEPRYAEGLLVFLCWMLAERYRLVMRDREESLRFNIIGSAGTRNFQRLFAS